MCPFSRLRSGEWDFVGAVIFLKSSCWGERESICWGGGCKVIFGGGNGGGGSVGGGEGTGGDG